MRIIPIAIFVSFALLAGSLLLQLNAPKHSNSEQNASPFPIITVEKLDGGARWKPESLRGRVTVLNFFASWCQPCAEEMPEFVALKKQFPGIHLQGIAWNDKPAPLKNFLLKYSNPFEQVWLDKAGDATIALGIRGIPETIIIDGHGIVRYRIEGMLTPEIRKAEIDTLITQLLLETKKHAK